MATPKKRSGAPRRKRASRRNLPSPKASTDARAATRAAQETEEEKEEKRRAAFAESERALVQRVVAEATAQGPDEAHRFTNAERDLHRSVVAYWRAHPQGEWDAAFARFESEWSAERAVEVLRSRRRMRLVRLASGSPWSPAPQLTHEEQAAARVIAAAEHYVREGWNDLAPEEERAQHARMVLVAARLAVDPDLTWEGELLGDSARAWAIFEVLERQRERWAELLRAALAEVGGTGAARESPPVEWARMRHGERETALLECAPRCRIRTELWRTVANGHQASPGAVERWAQRRAASRDGDTFRRALDAALHHGARQVSDSSERSVPAHGEEPVRRATRAPHRAQ